MPTHQPKDQDVSESAPTNSTGSVSPPEGQEDVPESVSNNSTGRPHFQAAIAGEETRTNYYLKYVGPFCCYYIYDLRHSVNLILVIIDIIDFPISVNRGRCCKILYVCDFNNKSYCITCVLVSGHESCPIDEVPSRERERRLLQGL